MPRKTSVELFFKPHHGFVMLALGTMTITAGSKHLISISARLTFIEGYSRFSGLAVYDAFDNFIMIDRHFILETGDIFRAESTKNVFN